MSQSQYIQIQPSGKEVNPRYVLLNRLGLNQYPGYVKSGCGVTYLNDARLVDAARGSAPLALDQPALVGSIPLGEIEDVNLSNYDMCAPNASLNNGQIQYYLDNTTKDAFYEPVFGLKSKVYREDWVTPMGDYKPQFTRKPVQDECFSCLSFINDTSFQREDIMSLQQRAFNATRFGPRVQKNENKLSLLNYCPYSTK